MLSGSSFRNRIASLYSLRLSGSQIVDDQLINLLLDVFDKEGATKFRLTKLNLADYSPSYNCCSEPSPLERLLSKIGKRLKELRLDDQTYSDCNNTTILMQPPPPTSTRY